MNVLVLGGTRFVGRWIVEELAARRHRVTLLHRGHSNAALFPEHEHVVADRTRELTALENRSWDAAIDCSGYTASEVERSAQLLRGAVGRYVFVSTAAVYSGAGRSSWDEHTPFADANESSYGGRKRACEQIVEALFGSACTITRPGLVFGPEDPDDRLSYWLRRIQRGGPALVPGIPTQLVQAIDARDHAAFVVDSVERDRGGAFNVDGNPISVRELLDGCRAALPAHEVAWTWVAGQSLAEQGLADEELPDYLPFWSKDDSLRPCLDIGRAVAAGLTLRPIADTARSVLSSERFRDAPARYLSPEREAELLRRSLR